MFFLVFTGVLSFNAWQICIYGVESQPKAVLYKNFTNPCWLVYPSRLKV